MRDAISMGEGNTPLIASNRIPNFFWKLESVNPTGSYKDRFIAAELAHRPAPRYVATSSGNTGSSLAAYCARAGRHCTIIVNADAPSGKLLQMRAHGAQLLAIANFSTKVFEILESSGLPLIVSAFKYCPTGMAAVGGIGTELNSLNPYHVFIPAGSGGLFIAISRALAGTRTRVHAVQPAGCATIVNGYKTGRVQPVQLNTRISGLAVPFDIDASLAVETLHANNGTAIAVTDDEVFAAQRDMLHNEGIFAEPAGATAYAGFLKANIPPNQTSVCIVSGSGFKDPASLEAAANPVQTIDLTHLKDLLCPPS